MGKVMGQVVSEDANIGGYLLGSLNSLNVTLRSTAHIEGDITHKTLVMEQGAYFEGSARRSENPMAANSQIQPPIIDGTSAPTTTDED